VHKAGDTTSMSKGGDAVIEDGSGNLWLCTNDNKLGYYDLPEGKFYSFSMFANSSDNSNSENTMFEDRGRNIWITSEFDGVYVFNSNQKKIYRVSNDAQALSPDFSICIFQTKTGQLLLGTNSGIDTLDKGNGKSSPFQIMENGIDI